MKTIAAQRRGALFVFAVTAAAAVFLADDCLAGTGEPDLQHGDFLVGVAVDQPFDGIEGRLVRVRDGQATVFCAPVTGNAGVPGYWNAPSEVLIDAQGRVVFVAYLHGNDPVPHRGFGLWR